MDQPTIDGIRVGSQQRPGANKDPRLDWWREARFGMFIHWGLYALPAGRWNGAHVDGIGEWIMKHAQISVDDYAPLAKEFNPVGFDAKAWVALAKAAGQRYITITSKHHDGFCMYKTALTPYNIVDATPFGRDPMRELADECARQDVRLCFYYSQTQDWYQPDGDGNDWDFNPTRKDFAAYVENYVKPQVRELLTNYGPVGLIWFDTPYAITMKQSQSLLDLVHELQPACLVNGRLGNHLGDYASARDNVIPGAVLDADWETPATINDTWGFKVDDEDWKSPTTLVRQLIDIVSKGGNYLLNVGPTAEGTIPQPSIDRLLIIGEWLARNGDAIYGTKAGPIQDQAWCRTTTRGGRVYLHVFDWPADGVLRVEGIAARTAHLLADGTPLAVEPDGDAIRIIGPAVAPDAMATVVVIE